MNRDEIVAGTLHLQPLPSLARKGKMDGFEIAKFIEGVSVYVLRVGEGPLYPAL